MGIEVYQQGNLLNIDLIAESPVQLQELKDGNKRYGLKVNVQKTKTITIGKQHEKLEVRLDGEGFQQVTEVVYLEDW